MTTRKTIALTIQNFVGRVMSLFFNMLPKFVTPFLPRCKQLLISWLKTVGGVKLHLVSNPGERNGNPLQYSCMETSIDRGDWWATVYRVTKSWTQLSDELFHFYLLSRASLVAQMVKNSPAM